MFENHRKSLIQHCERSELRLHFEWTKVNKKFQKCSKPEVFGLTVLPDRSILIGQKLVENAKVESLQKMIILGIFNQLLSTKNVNVARLAHNVEGDFFCDFQTPCEIAKYQVQGTVTYFIT